MAGGHIRKRGKCYSVIVELERDHKTGKRRQKCIGTFKRKEDAKKILNDTINKMYNNDFIMPGKLLVKDFLILWLETYAINLSPTTYYGYQVIINKHLIPYFGRIELQKLKPLHINKYYNEKSETLKGKTLLQHHRVLRKALDYAWKNQLIPKNPADMVDAPKVKKFESKVLNPEEAKKLLYAIKDTRFEIPINLGLSLGLRRGEMLGLRWSDIDFENGTITIQNNLVRVGTELLFKSPKTEGSIRTLAAPIELMRLLKEHRKKQMEIQLRSCEEYNNEHNLVCTRYDGSPINPSTFSHAFGDFLSKHELPHVRLHDLRHTNATLMLLSGTPAKVASSRLGHSSINITMDLYSHVLKDMNEDAAERLNEVIYK